MDKFEVAMSKMKAEAVELVEKVLKKFGQYENPNFQGSDLTKELLEIGPDAFIDAYLPESKLQEPKHWWSPRPASSCVKSSICLTGPILTNISTSEVIRGDGKPNDILGVSITIATPNGAAEIYLNDPDTAMKVMAAFAKAGSILGGKDEHSGSATA